MLPTNELHILLLDLAILAALYFAILFFWIYPDAELRGLRPKDYALMGFMLLMFLNVLGLAILVMVYLDDRKKLPQKHMRSQMRFQAHQKGIY